MLFLDHKNKQTKRRFSHRGYDLNFLSSREKKRVSVMIKMDKWRA